MAKLIASLNAMIYLTVAFAVTNEMTALAGTPIFA